MFNQNHLNRQTEHDKNLLVVVAMEGYGKNHGMDTKSVYTLFKQHDIINLIRSQYDALHTQDLSETIIFAEDVLKRKMQNVQ